MHGTGHMKTLSVCSTILCFKHLQYSEGSLLVSKYGVYCLSRHLEWSHKYLEPELLTGSQHKTAHQSQSVHAAFQCSDVPVSTDRKLAKKRHFTIFCYTAINITKSWEILEKDKVILYTTYSLWPSTAISGIKAELKANVLDTNFIHCPSKMYKMSGEVH
jgi:hypothetical protein